MPTGYWIACAAPTALVVLGLLAIGLLDLAGAECSYPNTPHGLDGAATCNTLGSISDVIRWWGPAFAIVTIPASVIGLVIGFLGARRAPLPAARRRTGEAGIRKRRLQSLSRSDRGHPPLIR